MPHALASLYPASSTSLSAKLATISTAFLIVACLAIGLTLIESWNLEGGAAGINALGSERMRSYRIAYLLAGPPRPGQVEEVRAELDKFVSVLRLIRQGDASRPLHLPKSESVHLRLQQVEADWNLRIRPLVERILAAPDQPGREQLLRGLQAEIEPFVASIDALVLILERHSDNNLSSLRTLQVGLLVLALLGTFVLLGLMYLVVVRPIHTLRDGMLRMQREDFGVRLPPGSRDELGELSTGFNNMAEHLQQLYATLELRVDEKTRKLAAHRDELKMLYEVTALFGRSQNAEEMCREFLRQLMQKYGATGGMVRLVDRMERQILLLVQEGLTLDFAAHEQCRQLGECFCGAVATQNANTVYMIRADDPRAVDYGCRKAGFGTVLALPILLHGRSLGLCNLFFRENVILEASERKLLETLSQHLGIAIESLRMIEAERELAISAERNLMAQELHDSIAQSLSFLNLQTQLLGGALDEGNLPDARSNLERIRSGVQESYDDVRELLVNFRTRVTHSDLETELAKLIYRFETQSCIKASFSQTGTALPLPMEYQAQVLYIVQEALSNVRKHAQASAVEVEMRRGDLYWFIICDNGCGLDEAAIDNGRHGGIGMSIMRERAQRIGGRIDIHSTRGQGTQVVLQVPLAGNRGG